MRSVFKGPGVVPRSTVAPLISIFVGGVLAASRLALEPVLRDQSPFLMAAPSMIVTAYLGGFWPTVLVGLIGLWAGEVAMTSAGGAALKPGGLIVYAAFTLVFAAAGGMRKRHLRRARDDAQRMAAMQARLARVARLNAMGEMAGTLAHELNQPLTAIASYAGAAQWLVKDQMNGKANEVVELLQKVSDQAVRAREIISRIRGQVNSGELDLQPNPLSAMFREAVGTAAQGAPLRAAVRYDFEGSDEVLADRIQVLQVMINLVRNALEAMVNAPRPQLRIGSRASGPELIEAYVADTGPGLPPDVAAHLFEPFVSGKDDGMGIGLSVSRNIVEAHGGRIWAEAGPDGGAIFRFTLPRAGAAIAPIHGRLPAQAVTPLDSEATS